ncbi:MAG: methyl-accepting chemotaxis protein [Deltaproteobacteria bacterium]|nr:methyl-accepting chemotaxis protein [Deltaproteobacteria bacterium]
MKLKQKFLLIFMVLIFAALAANSYINFKTTEKAVVQNAIKSMENELNQVSTQIEAFHEKASSELIFALNYPVFKEYFSLKDTKAGNRYDKDGVIQFTPAQRNLKGKIDEWTLFVQSKFPVAETCVIDKTGQEHSRITFGEIAPDEDFSNEENSAAFFDPTMRLGKDGVHIEYPYMSADAHQWVFSYTSPIVIDDGSIPAFYHFEIPISYFQEVVAKAASGQVFVLDPKGILVADSKQKIDINLKKETGGAHNHGGNEHSLKDYLPPVDSVSDDSAFMEITKSMTSGASGSGTFLKDGEVHYIVYRKLPAFGWSIAQVKSYSELLAGKSSLGQIKKTILATVVLTLIAAAAIIFVVSDRITKPLLLLTEAVKKVAGGDLEVEMPEVRTKDEIADLSAAMGDMVIKLREIVADVELAADKVTEASGDIQASSESMSSGVGEQATKATQIATASEEMSQTIIEIARSSSSIASTATTTTGLAQEGEKIVERSIKEVNDISEMVENLSGIVRSLGGRSEQIGQIVGVINEIAEQTNLLALNAAIEAARAGEQGRGFAVVADEVRNLSERTAKSTGQINTMIKSIQDEVKVAIASMEEGTRKVGEGVEFSAQAGKALQGIVDSVKNLHSMVEQIATATNQLSNVSEQISMDIAAVASVSNNTTGGTKEITKSAGELARQSASLQGAVRRFKNKAA